jgi:hypothetical protein
MRSRGRPTEDFTQHGGAARSHGRCFLGGFPAARHPSYRECAPDTQREPRAEPVEVTNHSSGNGSRPEAPNGLVTHRSHLVTHRRRGLLCVFPTSNPQTPPCPAALPITICCKSGPPKPAAGAVVPPERTGSERGQAGAGGAPELASACDNTTQEIGPRDGPELRDTPPPAEHTQGAGSTIREISRKPGYIAPGPTHSHATYEHRPGICISPAVPAGPRSQELSAPEEAGSTGLPTASKGAELPKREERSSTTPLGVAA